MAISGGLGLPVILLLLFPVLYSLAMSDGQVFSFEVHHKFSDHVRQWMSSAMGVPVDEWPEKGSVDYYATLVHHDRVLHGRNLAGNGPPLTFEDGNMTLRINSLGFLHYTTVEIGTPGVRFLVALDTGSNLFWVPCMCESCSTAKSLTNLPGIELSVYSPSLSATSKHVTCNANLCDSKRRCSGTTDECLYEVRYVSADTSSSGVLIEDILHLSTEDSQPELLNASIVFGCGQVQTGSFVGGVAPNGLFGLGLEKISVPSILASDGLIANSFSMCFSRDGIGRINFGDKGSADQESTPFNVDQLHPTYNISITGVQVDTEHIKIEPEHFALFDTGTSFTCLADPVYTLVAQTFNSKVRDPLLKPPDSRFTFDYCYGFSGENSPFIPDISITMKGGGKFPVISPIIWFSTPLQYTYCLAVVKSSNLNIIGQNFMTGHRIVFDREKFVLGWKIFDCYDTEGSATLSVKPPPITLPPVSDVSPRTFNPEDAIINRHKTRNSCPSSLGSATETVFTLSFVVFVLILL